jgi:hypothetical protein
MKHRLRLMTTTSALVHRKCGRTYFGALGDNINAADGLGNRARSPRYIENGVDPVAVQITVGSGRVGEIAGNGTVARYRLTERGPGPRRIEYRVAPPAVQKGVLVVVHVGIIAGNITAADRPS